MRIELNVKLEFDLNNLTYAVEEARISSREVGVKIAEASCSIFCDGTNDPYTELPHPAAVLPSVEFFMRRNQQIFERG